MFYIFCKRQISIKLFDLYQRLQCTGNYFFKIKFVFFLYFLLSASWKENDLSRYISVIRQTVGYRTPVFTQPFSWCLHITITYNLPNLWLRYVAVVTVIAWTPEVVCPTYQMSRHEKGETWSELTWFETSVLKEDVRIESVLVYCNHTNQISLDIIVRPLVPLYVNINWYLFIISNTQQYIVIHDISYIWCTTYLCIVCYWSI